MRTHALSLSWISFPSQCLSAFLANACTRSFPIWISFPSQCLSAFLANACRRSYSIWIYFSFASLYFSFYCVHMIFHYYLNLFFICVSLLSFLMCTPACTLSQFLFLLCHSTFLSHVRTRSFTLWTYFPSPWLLPPTSSSASSPSLFFSLFSPPTPPFLCFTFSFKIC